MYTSMEPKFLIEFEKKIMKHCEFFMNYFYMKRQKSEVTETFIIYLSNKISVCFYISFVNQ